jgi:hypothetical protein
MSNGRCRMHGGRSGGPLGERNGAYKHGKFTREARELSQVFRDLARAGEALLARTLDTHGLGRKLPAQLRRRAHVRKARADAKAKGQQK